MVLDREGRKTSEVTLCIYPARLQLKLRWLWVTNDALQAQTGR